MHGQSVGQQQARPKERTEKRKKKTEDRLALKKRDGAIIMLQRRLRDLRACMACCRPGGVGNQKERLCQLSRQMSRHLRSGRSGRIGRVVGKRKHPSLTFTPIDRKS